MQVSEVCMHHKKPEPYRITASSLSFHVWKFWRRYGRRKGTAPCAAVPWPCAQIAAWPAVGVEGVRECCREHRQNVRDDAIALSSRCRALRVCRPMHTQPTLLHRVLLLSRFGRWKFEWEGFKSPGSSKKMIYFCFWRNRLRIFCTVRKFDGGSLY